MATKNQLKLYAYWKSSSSSRVRIALALKGLEYEYVPVNLEEGQQSSNGFREISPAGYVPVLVDGNVVVSDSFAILLYLEEKRPRRHPLMPSDLQKKAVNYQVANIVNSNIQPFHNKNVLKYIEEKLGAPEKLLWAIWHIEKGFAALERLLQDHAGRYAIGDDISMADLFLATQIDYSVKNFKVDMGKFPLLSKLNGYYADIPAFQDAVPEKRPDAPSATN